MTKELVYGVMSGSVWRRPHKPTHPRDVRLKRERKTPLDGKGAMGGGPVSGAMSVFKSPPTFGVGGVYEVRKPRLDGKGQWGAEEDASPFSGAIKVGLCEGKPPQKWRVRKPPLDGWGQWVGDGETCHRAVIVHKSPPPNFWSGGSISGYS